MVAYRLVLASETQDTSCIDSTPEFILCMLGAMCGVKMEFEDWMECLCKYILHNIWPAIQFCSAVYTDMRVLIFPVVLMFHYLCTFFGGGISACVRL